MGKHITQNDSKMLQSVSLSAGLYLVATPIGNLRDITLRALDVLSGVDNIICEDSRVSQKLLSAYNIKKPLIVYNDHNAQKQKGTILEKLSNGASLALISDAGMPLVSDPGYKLVQDCMDLGLPVTTLPGASASLAALQLSGLPSDNFTFLGFLPAKSAARQKELLKWKAVSSTLILFESPRRISACLKDIKEVLGDRDSALVREITKMHEEVIRGKVSDVLSACQNNPPKGEIVLIIEGRKKGKVGKDNTKTKVCLDEELELVLNMEEALGYGLKYLKTKEASQLFSELTGISKKEIYNYLIEKQNP